MIVYCHRPALQSRFVMTKPFFFTAVSVVSLSNNPSYTMIQRERSHHAAIKQRFEERVSRAREGVLLTRRRHNKLVRRRAQEVVHLSDEMSALRRGVTELERRMFAAW